MGWEFDYLCWPWGRAFDRSCSPGGGDIWILIRPTWRYLTADSDGRDWDRTCFPASTLHARDIRSGIERSENHGSQREQAKGELISLYWSIEPLRYCGIKVNGSKEKPRRFLQVLISVWPIRYNHCIKLKKLTFFVAFTKNSISNLQNVDFLVKVSVSCYAVY